MIDTRGLFWTRFPPLVSRPLAELFYQRSLGIPRLTIEIHDIESFLTSWTSEYFCKVLDRVDHLIIRDISHNHVSSIINTFFPSLRQLTLEGDAWTEGDGVTIEWNAGSPNTFVVPNNIIALDLACAFIPRRTLTHLSNLTELYLRSSWAVVDKNTNWEYLVNMLPNIATLETFEMEIDTLRRDPVTNLEDMRIKLARLRRLRMYSLLDTIILFRRVFELPMLLDMSLEVEHPTDEEVQTSLDFGLMVREDLRPFGHRATRVDITATYARSPGMSPVALYAESGARRLEIVVPIPAAAVVENLSLLMQSYGLLGCDHLVLRSWPPEFGGRVTVNRVEDSAWRSIFRHTEDLQHLTISGYGDIWQNLGNLIGIGADLPWQSLVTLEMRRGFWVRLQVADDWSEALERRKKSGKQLAVLQFSQWEMQMSSFFKSKFQKVAPTVVWDVKLPGWTNSKVRCPHGTTFPG